VVDVFQGSGRIQPAGRKDFSSTILKFAIGKDERMGMLMDFPFEAKCKYCSKVEIQDAQNVLREE